MIQVDRERGQSCPDCGNLRSQNGAFGEELPQAGWLLQALQDGPEDAANNTFVLTSPGYVFIV